MSDSKMTLAEARKPTEMLGANAAIQRALRIIEIYFRPWGAAKAAEWGEVSGDRGCNAENALRLVQRELTR